MGADFSNEVIFYMGTVFKCERALIKKSTTEIEKKGPFRGCSIYLNSLALVSGQLSVSKLKVHKDK